MKGGLRIPSFSVLLIFAVLTVIGAAGRYEALCTGLDENGHLLVRDADGQERILSSGEISIRLSTRPQREKS